MTASSSSPTGGPLKSEQLAKEFYEQEDRFYRWRFLQDILEENADIDVVNQVLYQVLDGARKYARPDGHSGGEIVPLPSQVKEKIESLLNDKDVVVNYRVVALREDYEDAYGVETATTTLQKLEELLPTMDDDEDAVKSLWDTIIELYGGEAVKNQEQGEQHAGMENDQHGRTPPNSFRFFDSGNHSCTTEIKVIEMRL